MKRKYLYNRVLRFYPESEKIISLSTLKEYYLSWRDENKIPYWCDNSGCSLHYKNPKWKGKKITLEIDHIDAAIRNWRTKNLRLLCPNCHSQTDTFRAKDKGKIEYKPGGYVRDSHGQKNYKLMADTLYYKLKQFDAQMKK